MADSEGSFTVESSLSLDLWIHVLTEDTTDIHVFEIQSPSGQIFAFPKFDAGLIYFALRGPRETGGWSYRIRLYGGGGVAGGKSMLLECWAAGGAEQVSLTGWSRTAEAGEAASGQYQRPVILYARLEQAGLPVLQAAVSARVRQQSGQSAAIVLLVDDGAGYPDITRGDGIYSAYFTEFAPGGSSSHYSLEVEASNNGTASILNSRKSEVASLLAGCCGSSLPTAPTVPLESFRRYATAASFQVPTAASTEVKDNNRTTMAPRRDLFPPSRIADFRLANYFNNSLFVTLAWTAPGADLTAGGPAFRYEIRCFTERGALHETTFAEQGILVHASLVPSPGQPGGEQRSTVAVPWAREIFYYAIVAFDAAGNRGEVSNIVAVFVEEPVVVVMEEAASENSTLIYLNMEDLNKDDMMLQSVLQSDGLMYIIAGVISLILIIIVLILAIIIKRLGVCGSRHEGKPATSADQSLEEETVDSSVYMPDICHQDVNNASFARNSVSYVSGYDLADNLEFTLRSPQKAAAQEITNNNNNHHHRILLDPRYYCDSLMGKPAYSVPTPGGCYQTGAVLPPFSATPPPVVAGQSPSISPVNSTYTAHSTDCSVSVTSSSDPDQPPGSTETSGLQVLATAAATATQLQVLPTNGHLPYYSSHSHDSLGVREGGRRRSEAANRLRKVPPAVPNKTVHASLV